MKKPERISPHVGRASRNAYWGVHVDSTVTSKGAPPMDVDPLRSLFIHAPWYRALWYRTRRNLNPLRAWQNLCDFIQRGRRGYAANDWVDLNDYLAPIILGCLQRMREEGIAYPTDMTPEEWDASLDKMILAFQAVIDDAPDWCASVEFTQGFAEFYYRYPDLWD